MEVLLVKSKCSNATPNFYIRSSFLWFILSKFTEFNEAMLILVFSCGVMELR
jgi:hypothetical protein